MADLYAEHEKEEALTTAQNKLAASNAIIESAKKSAQNQLETSSDKHNSSKTNLPASAHTHIPDTIIIPPSLNFTNKNSETEVTVDDLPLQSIPLTPVRYQGTLCAQLESTISHPNIITLESLGCSLLTLEDELKTSGIFDETSALLLYSLSWMIHYIIEYTIGTSFNISLHLFRANSRQFLVVFSADYLSNIRISQEAEAEAQR